MQSGDPRAALREVVEGRSDDEIMELVGNLGGPEAILDLTFEGMKQAVDPAKAQDCVVGWRLKAGDDVHQYTVTIQGGSVEVAKREPTDARVTMGLSVPDYLRLISGNVDGMQAFMQGKLQVTGDLMFAAQLQQMFGLGA